MIKSSIINHDTMTEGTEEVGVLTTYCTFWLGNGLFAAEASLVKEVAVVPFVTPIPQAPGAVCGYVNLRGHIVFVLDMNYLFYRSSTQIGNDTRLVVFRSHLGDPFGILVDRIDGIVELSDDLIEKFPQGLFSSDGENRTPPEVEVITGIGKLDDELFSILDAHKLLSNIDKAIARRRANSLHREQLLSSEERVLL